MMTGARAATTTQIAIDTTQRMPVTSTAPLALPPRTAMSAPKPTNTPAISASERNSSVSCMSRQLRTS